MPSLPSERPPADPSSSLPRWSALWRGEEGHWSQYCVARVVEARHPGRADPASPQDRLARGRTVRGRLLGVSDLASAVLPLIRTRADLWRCSAANAHGRQMHEAVDLLEAAQDPPPAERLAVCQKAIVSAVAVILKADDSSGIIGDAVRRLLNLHPQLAAQAQPSVARLVDWLIAFQFDGRQDFFEIDPVAYAPALGDLGLKRYRDQLQRLRDELGPEPSERERWIAPGGHTRFALDWNARRLAVLDQDVDAIIATHARDRAVPRWLHDTAEALAEIDRSDLAIDWAKQATDHGNGHQSLQAADYWCALLAQHRPDQILAARWEVFNRWPTSSTASHLHHAAGAHWSPYREQVLDRLASRPRDAVLFALLTLQEPELAWDLAHELNLNDADAWDRILREYEKLNPIATLPVHTRLVEELLVDAGAQNYQRAAKRLNTMRALAAGTSHGLDVDAFIARLRETHRRRPRLLQELDRAHLP